MPKLYSNALWLVVLYFVKFKFSCGLASNCFQKQIYEYIISSHFLMQHTFLHSKYLLPSPLYRFVLFPLMILAIFKVVLILYIIVYWTYLYRLIAHTKKIFETQEEKLCLRVLISLREMMALKSRFRKEVSCISYQGFNILIIRNFHREE